MANEKDYKHIIRVINTDLVGSKPLIQALRKIKGVGFMFANAVCELTAIDKSKKAGYLSHLEISKLEEAIKDPVPMGAPTWMLNRRKDYETGNDMHIVETDRKFTIDNDIKRLKKTKSFKGLRHQWGLPLRGQRTKSNFRRNKGKGLGVKRRAGAKSGRV